MSDRATLERQVRHTLQLIAEGERRAAERLPESRHEVEMWRQMKADNEYSLDLLRDGTWPLETKRRLVYSPVGPAHDPEEASERLERALAILSPDERRLVWMVAGEGCPLETAAAALGMDLWAADHTLHWCLARLREYAAMHRH